MQALHHAHPGQAVLLQNITRAGLSHAGAVALADTALHSVLK